jgi:2,4-dienoyl-CoA reductase-like NADH-dependent reductase (Old Yellow Enzyme family)
MRGMGAATMTRIARFPEFQLAFTERVRREAGVPTIAVGLIMTSAPAAEVIDTGSADIVAIGRKALVNPNWPSAARTRLQPEGATLTGISWLAGS